MSKKYLPAVLAVIVANVNKVTNTELVQKAYQATEKILATSLFNGRKKFSLDHMTIIFIVVELRELTLYLHQSGIVDLHWHTDYRAYRVNSGLRLMLTILYKCELLCEPLKIPLQISVDTIIFFHKKPLICLSIYK